MQEENTKQYTLEKFKSGEVRILISTVAFGMGVHIHDIRTVIHYGPSSDTLFYWQEVGRSGRDGNLSRALLMLPLGV